jgi:hypothetical protein
MATAGTCADANGRPRWRAATIDREYGGGVIGDAVGEPGHFTRTQGTIACPGMLEAVPGWWLDKDTHSPSALRRRGVESQSPEAGNSLTILSRKLRFALSGSNIH